MFMSNCPVLEGDPDLAGFVIGYIEEQVMYGKTCVKRLLSKRPKICLQDQGGHAQECAIFPESEQDINLYT